MKPSEMTTVELLEDIAAGMDGLARFDPSMDADVCRADAAELRSRAARLRARLAETNGHDIGALGAEHRALSAINAPSALGQEQGKAQKSEPETFAQLGAAVFNQSPLTPPQPTPEPCGTCGGDKWCWECRNCGRLQRDTYDQGCDNCFSDNIVQRFTCPTCGGTGRSTGGTP